MKATDVKELTINLITEYYQGNYSCCFDSLDEKVLYFGPRTEQIYRGKQSLIKLFEDNPTDLTFELGDISQYVTTVNSRTVDVLLEYDVATNFPSGERQIHHQRLECLWKEVSRTQADGSLLKIPVVVLVNISNTHHKDQGNSIFAVSPADSGVDATSGANQTALATTVPSIQGPRVIIHGANSQNYYMASDNIRYIESCDDGRHCMIHTTEQTMFCTDKLAYFTTNYGSEFLRVHSSYIVNPLYVKSIKRFTLTLTDDKAIPIPEKKYTSFRDTLNRWFILHDAKAVYNSISDMKSR